MATTRTRATSQGWIPLSRRAPPNKHTVLLTNNLKATDAFGCMSHIWIGWPQRSGGPTESFPHHPPKGTWIAYMDDGAMVQNLTHWHPLPMGEEAPEHRAAVRQRGRRAARGPRKVDNGATP